MSALRMHAAGELKNDLVISTVMANLGFVRTLEEHGIEVIAAPVGDKFVAEAMAEHGAVLGGEQSGHLIYGMHSTTGDGLLTALTLADMVAISDSTLSVLATVFEPYPQVLINVRVRDRGRLDSAAELWDEVRVAETKLGSGGRVLLRASGTESIVRVMVEAADRSDAEATARSLAASVERYLA
jgi:phosphoglucosamine mutase